jgi:p-hydroxybenzoate 3-monooxygenase
MRVQVGIVGAGPAGLLLARLLGLRGIECAVLELRSRAHCESRVRAGVLEQGTVDTLDDVGVSRRLHAEGQRHEGIELRFGGGRHRIAFESLVPGRAITVYGQQEVVKDLNAAVLAQGTPIHFGVTDVQPHAIDTDHPYLTFDGQRLDCDFIAGCDGSHGICRPSIPDGSLDYFVRDYPFAWLGVLAAVAPSTRELIYSQHDNGFALHSMRSSTVSRFYLQVARDADRSQWPDTRIWEELARRLETVPGFTLRAGPIISTDLTPMRSLVAEPMRHGRLFLAGDAAHIVPPTGAKGLNLAVADVRLLADAIADWYAGDPTGVDTYSRRCLRRVWRAQHFSWWLTTLLHTFDTDDSYARRLRTAHLDYVVSSTAAATTLAENYVGLPLPTR